jgi:hypothetical protein
MALQVARHADYPRKRSKSEGSTKRRFFSRKEDFCQNARKLISTKGK